MGWMLKKAILILFICNGWIFSMNI
jgi:hypothetical protein